MTNSEFKAFIAMMHSHTALSRLAFGEVEAAFQTARDKGYTVTKAATETLR